MAASQILSMFNMNIEKIRFDLIKKIYFYIMYLYPRARQDWLMKIDIFNKYYLLIVDD